MLKLFIKRFLLIIIGIILSLILLECGLRLAGWTISSFQQYKNNKALRNKSQYTIMCLGESTTQGQYPVQLQEILDMKYPNKFSVIDCGISGTNLENILELLDNNINKYNPNITVCMIGINNGLTNQTTDISNIEYIKKTKNINLKIYKLFMLIKKHLISLIQQKNVLFAETTKDNNSMLEDAINSRNTGQFKNSETLLKKILRDNPNDEAAFLELCRLYSDFLGKDTIGYNMAINALEKNFDCGKGWYYKIIFDYLKRKNNIKELKYYINKAIKDDITIFSTEVKYFIYGYIKHYITNEQKEKILEIMTKDNDDVIKDSNSIIYSLMAIENLEQKNYQKTQEYFDKAEKLRLNFPNKNTYRLYKLITRKLIDNNIKVICMQYPVRSVLPLQEQLKNESYYDKITFISNEQNFKDALMKHNYDDLFIDQFAGDFGHCTESGNTMIAENVVNTLENILDLREKSN